MIPMLQSPLIAASVIVSLIKDVQRDLFLRYKDLSIFRFPLLLLKFISIILKLAVLAV